MSSNTLTKAAADRLKNTAAIASISVAVSLCLLKVFGALLTDSLDHCLASLSLRHVQTPM